MRWQFTNRQLMDFQRFTPDIAGPGVSAYDILMYQAKRGDFGPIPEGDLEAEVQRRVNVMRGGARYERRTASGKFIEFTFKPLEDGGLLAIYRDITELKEREEAIAAAKVAAEASHADLERTGTVLQTVLDNMSDGVMLLDPDLRIKFANQRLMEFQRYTPDIAHEGSSIAEVLHYQAQRGDFGEVENADEIVNQRLAMIREPGGIHYERRSASGKYLEITFRPLADGSVLAVNRDITELKEREEAAERTRQIMQTVLDNMIGGVMLFDQDFRLQFVNRQVMEFQNYPSDIIKPGIPGEEILRFQVKRGDFGPVKDIEKKVRERVALIRKPGGNRFLRKTLEGRYVEFNFLPLGDGGLLAFGRDVTSLKEREEALATAKEAAEKARDDVERTREVMQTVLDNMSDGVTLWDKNFRWQFSNRFSTQMWGYKQELLQPGVSGFDMIRSLAQQGEFGPTEDIERTVTDVTRRILKPGGARYEQRTATGKYIEFNFRPLSDGGLLGLYRDITALKSREEALATAKEAAESARDTAEKERAEAEAANQSKSTFLATMSHEIRTPMNGVLGMIDVLQRQGLDGPQRRTVSTIRDSAQSLLRIIDDVLDFSKIEAGRLELEETAFSLSGLIEGVAGTFRQQAMIKGLSLDVEIDPGSDDALVGDPTRVRQVLFNLLGNAIKFTERGRITLHAGTQPLGHGDTRITIAVSDTGIGLSEDQRLRLFQPFAQADSSTTRRFGGTGLGLSIVRRLAQLMKGDIRVESNQGAGSTFTVTLTLKAAPADSPLNTTLRTSPRPARSPAARRPKSGARILVADDHPVNREVLVRQLELLGIASDTANDGVEALEAWSAAEGKFAAVLADIHMPRMDGRELTRQIRVAEAQRGSSATRTPIVAVTANAMKGEDERCLAAGMDAYLAKPVNLDQLRATLERWMPIDDPARDASEADEAPKPPSAVDREVLAAWLGDDDKAINSLLAKFRDTAVAAEREIGAASRAGDLPTLAAAAHKLKGAAQTVGAAGVGTAAATLEQAGKAGDRTRCREGLGPLATELRRALADIDRMNAAAK
jgi:signal transduction histidine kinase/HPt (histidine-containing phosphotransfer) domain-containing protein/FixJ family two-component response regulator